MPNYSLVIDSKFRPFTFAELAAPWQMYGEAYKEQEAALADLDTKASVWENMVNKETDPELYQQYKNYVDELTSQADVLATQGLTPGARQAIKKLGSRYSKEIVPIEQAFNTRKEQAKMQLQARMTNPSLMFSRDVANTRLLDYVNNPELDFETISGNDITQRVFTQASALSKELIDNKEDLRKVLGGDYYEYVKQRGFTKEAVLAAIMDSPEASSVLTQLVESAVDSTPVKGWNNDIMTNRVREYAKQGLWGAVGTSEAQLVNNWRAQTNLQHANAIKLEDKRFDHAKEEAKVKNKYQYTFPFKSSDGNTYLYNPYLGMYTDEDGNIVERPKDAPRKIGTEPGNPKETKLTATTADDIKSNGYSLVGVTMQNRDGSAWESYGDGEKLNSNSRRDSFYTYRKWFLSRDRADLTPNMEGNHGSMTSSNMPKLYELSDEDMINTFYKGDSEDLTDEGMSIHNYIVNQLEIPDGIFSDNIKIVIATTPNIDKTGKCDYLIFKKYL